MYTLYLLYLYYTPAVRPRYNCRDFYFVLNDQSRVVVSVVQKSDIEVREN